MAFDQSSITAVSPPQYRGNQALLSWTSSAPAGTWFQVYVNQELAWMGSKRRAWIPIPSGPVRIDIGAVGTGERDTSFAASLPPAPARRARLTWQAAAGQAAAGTAGYRIYSATTPGGAISYTAPIATVLADPAAAGAGGFGAGGFGVSGFGGATANYEWTSDPLAAGNWSFAVVPYDAAGNTAAVQTTTVTIAAPPRSPAAFAVGRTRLKYTLAGSPPVATLSWQAPPS